MGIIKKKILDYLTGKYIDEGYPTDVQIASGTSATLSASSSLFNILVPAGTELIVLEADVFSSSSVSHFQLTYSQTVSGVPLSQTKYYNLYAAGNIMDKGSMKQPILVMQNLTTGSVSVSLKVITPTSGAAYTANVAYVLRSPFLP